MATPQIAVPEMAEELTAEDRAALDAERTGQEPTQQPEPAPEQQVQQQPEPPQKPEKGKLPEHVPYTRFQEVNDERRRVAQERDELRERWARLEERQKLAREADERIKQAAQTPLVQGKPRPDETVDPYGAQLWDRDRRIEEVLQQVQQLQQGQQQTQLSMQQQNELNQFADWLRSDVTSYERQHADYPQAVNHIFTKFTDFARDGLGANEQEAQALLGAVQQMVTVTARKYGRSPAAALDGLARAFGYAPAQQQQQQPVATDTARTKLEQAQKGQAFQGLSRVPAENPDAVTWTTLGAKELADMDEDEFSAAWADPKRRPQLEAAMRRLDLGA